MKRLVVAAMLIAAPLAAQEAAGTPRTVTVNATGHVERAPDRVVLAFAAETTGKTAVEASQANARTMHQLLDALGNAGVPKDRIHTQRLSLQPQYAQPKPGERSEPQIIGYRAQNQVQVTLDQVDRAGAIVDAAVGAGANRVSGILVRAGGSRERAYRCAPPGGFAGACRSGSHRTGAGRDAGSGAVSLHGGSTEPPADGGSRDGS